MGTQPGQVEALEGSTALRNASGRTAPRPFSLGSGIGAVLIYGRKSTVSLPSDSNRLKGRETGGLGSPESQQTPQGASGID